MVDFEERRNVELREPDNKETQLFQLQLYESKGLGYLRSKNDNRLCLGIEESSKGE